MAEDRPARDQEGEGHRPSHPVPAGVQSAEDRGHLTLLPGFCHH